MLFFRLFQTLRTGLGLRTGELGYHTLGISVFPLDWEEGWEVHPPWTHTITHFHFLLLISVLSLLAPDIGRLCHQVLDDPNEDHLYMGKGFPPFTLG